MDFIRTSLKTLNEAHEAEGDKDSNGKRDSKDLSAYEQWREEKMPWFPVLYNIYEGNLVDFSFAKDYDLPVDKIKSLLEILSDVPRAAWHVNREIYRYNLNKNPKVKESRTIPFLLYVFKKLILIFPESQ